MNECRSAVFLDAYHDREMGWIHRWRLGRHLRRCETCRRELHELDQVGEWVRGSEPVSAAPDLWPSIAAQLPELDREIATGAPPIASRAAGLPRFALPLGAGIAVATAALGLALLWPEPPRATTGVVRSLYSPSQPVMVLEDSEESTIIWVMDNPADQRSEEVGRAIG